MYTGAKLVKLIQYFVSFRTSAEIQQFTRGIDSLGTLWQTVKENAAKFKPLLCTAPQALDKAQFERLCVYDRSPEGSNNRIAEEQSIYSWEMFLQDIEGRIYQPFSQRMLTSDKVRQTEVSFIS
jgi:hypothetical protein